MSVLSKKYFHDEEAAFLHLEKLLWGDGVICPKCGEVDRAGRLEGVKGKNGDMVAGAVHRSFQSGDNRFAEMIKGSFRTSPSGKISGYGLVRMPMHTFAAPPHQVFC